MSDVEIFQSFCRRYVNPLVREHFNDVQVENDDDLDIDAPRHLARKICTHKDTDPLSLTVGRLLIWQLEANSVVDEVIYGVPATHFQISHSFLPQLQLHFREKKVSAYQNNRKQARSVVSVRWREEDFTTTNINNLANKIKNLFATPVFHYKKGRKIYTYIDKRKGYNFIVKADNETEAKKIIEQTYSIQDTGLPDWEEFLKVSESQKNYSQRETIQVMGKTVVKPKRRPIAEVYFQYAELHIPGKKDPLILVDRTGTKAGAIRVA